MNKMKRLAAMLLAVVLFVGLLPATVPEANAATPLLWPVPGHFALSRGYSSDHNAMDIHDENIKGANIVAAMGGTIVRISKCTIQHEGETHTCGGTGTGVVIKGDDNRYYSYAHMIAGSIPSSFVVNKTKVKAGDFLGRVGTTGNSSGPHLHFSIATGKGYLDNRINPEYETYTSVGTTAFTFSKLASKMSVSNNDAVIAVSLSKPENNRLVSYGATVYDNNGVVLGKTSANSSGQKGVSNVSLWWTVSSSMGITLSPGRTYQFDFWANVSGVTLTSPKYSFTTTGTAKTYTMSYNANGGTGAPASQTKTAGTALTLSSTKPTRTGYTFKGWATSASGSVAYQPGSSFATDANTTLYAVWEKNVSATDAQIVVSSGEAMPGEAITVTIALKNNPGIASLKLRVSYGDMLTLTDISYNTAIGGMSQQPQTMASPVTLNWFNGIADSTGDWTFATLTFVVSETAQAGDTADITVTYNADDVYNIADKNVAFAVVNGTVEVADYMPGDINADGTVNNRDLTRLFQYLSDWNVEVNEPALDVNGDGSVNNRDLTRLFQYLSDWNVEIH